MSQDLQGREYAKINKVDINTVVEVDGDFTCMEKGQEKTVAHMDGNGLFISCRRGKHFLSGQIKEDFYLGLYLIKE